MTAYPSSNPSIPPPSFFQNEQPVGLGAETQGHLTVLRGDALMKLAELPDESVQCCVTSPPYWGLRDYGVPGQLGLEETPEAYVAKIVEVFREVRRVLKDDGTLWMNLGDSYLSNVGGSPDGSKTKGGVAGHVPNAWGGRSQSPVKRPPYLKPKDLCGIPWRVAFALQADGWYLRSDIIWHKPNPMPESVTDRPTKAHEYLFLLSKRERYFYDAEAIREKGEGYGRCNWNALQYNHDYWLTHGGHGGKGTHGRGGGSPTYEGDRNKRSVWTVPAAPYAEAHFATFPPDLIKPCILAGSRAGDVVLDPFAGSGTTGMVAIALERQTILIELNPEYIHLIEQRCNVTEGLAWLTKVAKRTNVNGRRFDVRRTRRYKELLNSL